jgi:Tol biopolymer transport system component
VPVQGGAERPLTQKRWLAVGDLAWVPDGRGLVATTQEQGLGLVVQVVYVSYANGEVRRITNDLNYYTNVSVTADSRVVATTQMEFSWDAWVALMAALDSAKPITSDGRVNGPTWSPDGRIVYFNVADGNIWLMGADGSNPKQLTSNTEEANLFPRFSPDGQYIVFDSDRAGSLQIWRIDSDGNNPKQLTDSPFQDWSLDCSPDGKWVVYSKWGPEKGIWKVPMEGGNPVRLTGTEEHFPTISPDGRMIAYSYEDPSANPPHGVAIMAFEGGPPTKRFDILSPTYTWFRWATDSRSLLYTKNEVGFENI